MGLKLDGSNSRINADVTAPTFKTAKGTCTLNWRDSSQDAVAFCDGFNNQEITINCTWVSSNNTISGAYTFSGLESSEQKVDGMNLSLSYDSTSKNVSVSFYKEVGRDYTMTCTIEVTYTTGIETGKHIEIHGNTRIDGSLNLNGGFEVKTVNIDSSIKTLNKSLTIDKVTDTVTVNQMTSSGFIHLPDITNSNNFGKKISGTILDKMWGVKALYVPTSNLAVNQFYLVICDTDDGRFGGLFYYDDAIDGSWTEATRVLIPSSCDSKRIDIRSANSSYKVVNFSQSPYYLVFLVSTGQVWQNVNNATIYELPFYLKITGWYDMI